jgi:ubiquinone biosynthesis UbiH/UbiF/VisC/COQ6 family hydroxylase
LPTYANPFAQSLVDFAKNVPNTAFQKIANTVANKLPHTAATVAKSAPEAHTNLHRVDVCVLGGGAVALAALLSTRAQGLSTFHILPLPQALPEQTVPRTYAIAPRTQAYLDSLGVWGLLTDKQVQLCTDMCVFWHMDDDFHTVEPIDLSATLAGVGQLCSFVGEHDLLAALNTVLLTKFASQQHAYYDPQNPAQTPQIEPLVGGSGVQIMLKQTDEFTQSAASHSTVLAKIGIIAEGAGSRSAAQLGLSPTVHDYSHSAVVAVLHSDKPSAATAWQWLGSATQGYDVLALLPMPPLAESPATLPASGARYGLVWSQPRAQAQNWVGRSDDLLAAVQARCGNRLGQLSIHSATQQFPLTRSAAPSCTAGQCVLVGDAAHKIHPLAGQGLNLGFEDVRVLFETLAQREPWRDLGDARLLARYQRRRAAQTQAIESVVHGLANRSAWNQGVRQVFEHSLKLHNDVVCLGDRIKKSLIAQALR